MLENKVALITGAASGIGREVALELARKKCNVVVNYVTESDASKELINEIKQLGVKVLGISCDVSNYAQVENMIKTINEEFGTLNIVVNNAGITKDGLILRMNEEQYDSVLDVNLKGAWNVCKHSSKTLLKAGYARIINISSVVGITGNAGQSNYSSSKAGVIGLTKSLAKELGSRGVTVNAIAPGFIETKMTQKLDLNTMEKVKEQVPLQRLGNVNDVAKVVCFLASEDASYITGEVIKVDGGLAI